MLLCAPPVALICQSVARVGEADATYFAPGIDCMRLDALHMLKLLALMLWSTASRQPIELAQPTGNCKCAACSWLMKFHFILAIGLTYWRSQM